MPSGSECTVDAGYQQADEGPGLGRFPTEGAVNVLIVVVQDIADDVDHCWDMQDLNELGNPELVAYSFCDGTSSRYESTSDDPTTEWPAINPTTQEPSLPSWAHDLIDAPGTDPDSYTAGSLSHYYWTMSGGRPGHAGEFRLEGIVYPELMQPEDPIWTYTTAHGPGGTQDPWYDDFHYANLEVMNRIVERFNSEGFPAGFDPRDYDLFENGTRKPGSDGELDMVVFLHRRSRGQAVGMPEAEPAPVFRIDNDEVAATMSVFGGAIVPHHAVSIIAHEIGHHQISGHTHPWAESHGNSMSVMWGHSRVAMAATDRMVVGWLSPDVVASSGLSVVSKHLEDAFMSDDALCISANGACTIGGDIIVEARTADSFWNGSGFVVDGDWDDGLYGSEPGLYVYKRDRTAGTGFPFFTSMERTGHTSRQNGAHRLPIGFRQYQYDEGSSFTPLSLFRFPVPQGSGPNPPVDPHQFNRLIGLTHIATSSTGFSFDVFGDFLGTTTPRAVSGLYTLNAAMALARWDDWSFGGYLEFDDGLEPVTAFSPTITLLENARLVIPAGEVAFLTGLPSQRLPVTGHLRSFILVDGGALMAEYVDFQPASGTTWGGLRFYQNAMSVLTRSSVTGVLSGTDLGAAPGAVTVYGGAVVIDDSEVSGTTNGDGVHAAGPAAEVTVTGTGATLIEENDGNGVVAAGGALARVDGLATIGPNPGGSGVLATGSGSRVVLAGATISFNEGPGVAAEFGGVVEFDDESATNVSDNAGGLSANKSAEVQAGVCPVDPCEHVANDIAFNAQPGGYDVRAENGSVVLAEGNTWGDITDPGDLVLIVDGTSYISVEPFANGGSLWDSRPSAHVSQAGFGTGEPGFRGGVPAFAEASRRLAAGDTTGAFAAVLDALHSADSPSERRAAFGAGLRLLALAQPAGVVTWIEQRTGGPERPWALEALSVAYAYAGRAAEAHGAAEALASEFPGGEHRVSGLATLVRLAVLAGNLNAAATHLGSLRAAAPGSDLAASMAALVAAAFPGETAAAPFAGYPAHAAAALRVSDTHIGSVRPNPAQAAATMRYSLDQPARVSWQLIDLLGRRLSMDNIGHLEAGLHELRLDVRRLPVGTYVLLVTVQHDHDPYPLVRGARLTVRR